MSYRTTLWMSLLVLLIWNVGMSLSYNGSLLLHIWNEWRAESRKGFTSRQLTDGSGEESRYVLFVPEKGDASKRLPLLLFLNGYGENGRDGARQISNNFGEPLWEVQRDFPIICLAPQCRNRWAIGSDEMKRAIRILDHVVKQYNVDPDRIYVTGVSAGGAGAWNMAAAYPERFAAIVPMSTAGSVADAQSVEEFANNNLAIWSFYNDADPAQGLVRNHENIRERLFAAGLSPMFTTFEQDRHDSWNAGYRSAPMFEWLGRQSRSENAKRAARTRFRELLANESELRMWKASGAGEWSVTDRILTCCRVDPNVACELTFNADLAEFELHFDYRSASDAGCEIALVSGDDVLRVRFEPPAQGTGGLLHEASSEWLGTVSPVGQVGWLSGRWNDLRVSLRDGAIQLVLNGAELLEVRDARLAGKHCVKLCVPAGGPNDREWRYLRLWDPSGSTLAKELTSGE